MRTPSNDEGVQDAHLAMAPAKTDYRRMEIAKNPERTARNGCEIRNLREKLGLYHRGSGE